MFEIFKKNKICNITAPVVGESISLDEVPDKVFSERMIGDGVAFRFDGDTVYAPCNGEIIMIADTGHAFAFRTDNDTEILLHVGLDTVNLKGNGMKVLVQNNVRVTAGEPILKINRKIMSERDVDLTTSLIISNMSEYDMEIKDGRPVNLKSTVVRTKKK